LNATALDITERARRVVGLQILASVVLAIGLFVGVSAQHGRSAFYGGMVSAALALLLGRGVKRAEAVAAANPRQSMVILYVGAAQRFFLAVAAFAVGMAFLKLEPLAVFVGFAAAQIAYLINARSMAQSKKGV
jgi:ATP synthase protein I